jgi:ATP-dependent DNA helicase RecG
MFTVVFNRPKYSQESSQESSQENLNKTSKEILKLVKNKKDITTTEMANKLNISRRAIAKHISKLKENGMIARIGSTKSGFWKIL